MRTALHDTVTLLRRYDPSDPQHYIVNQFDGSQRFASSVWHDSGQQLDDEYSVFDAGILARDSVPVSKCVKDRFSALASISVAQVRELRSETITADHLDAFSDPLTRVRGEITDPAHAVIWVSNVLSRSQRGKVRTQLALRLRQVAFV